MKYSVQEKLQLRREAAITNLKSAGGAHHAASGRCAGFWYSAVYSMFAVALLFCCFSCMDLEELKESFYSYSITYNLNNGDWARTDYTAPATYTASQTVKLPSSFYVKRDGYRFDGWYDNKEFSGSAVSGWEAGEKSGAVKLYAKWTAGMSVSDAMAVISNLTAAESPCTVVMCGDLTQKNLYGLKPVLLAAARNGVKVALDMSDCTGIKTLAVKSFSDCSNLTSVKLPASVMSIKMCAFENCSGLTSVTVPDSVIDIDMLAFCQCNNLSTVSVDAGNKAYESIDGALFTKDKKSLVYYPSGKIDTEYVIPAGVTEIEKYAFICCENLRSVIIPESVTSIGINEFLKCSALASLTFIDPKGWYKTESEVDWEHKTGGTSVVLGNKFRNKEYFTSICKDHYWYKK